MFHIIILFSGLRVHTQQNTTTIATVIRLSPLELNAKLTQKERNANSVKQDSVTDGVLSELCLHEGKSRPAVSVHGKCRLRAKIPTEHINEGFCKNKGKLVKSLQHLLDLIVIQVCICPYLSSPDFTLQTT